MTPEKPSKPLRAGDPLPEFSGRTATGGVVSRESLIGRPTVLFFYPKAGSAGCSMEAREFARLHPEFGKAGVTVVGISVDPPSAQQGFREKCGLPFDLVADDDRSISARFGVLGRLGLARRTTFVLGRDGRVVAVLRTWRPGAHAQRALELSAAQADAAGTGPGRDSGGAAGP